MKYEVYWDGRINSDLNRALQRMKALGESVDDRKVRQQLRRKSFPLALPEPPAEELTPAEIYQQRRDAVVVIGTLFGDGNYTVASGVIVDPAGIVATAYHVIDKPPPVLARGVMTRSGKVYAVREILAADKPGDVALLKIDASNLAAAPVSHGDPEGTPVTVISHPSSNFFSLTQGTSAAIGRLPRTASLPFACRSPPILPTAPAAVPFSIREAPSRDWCPPPMPLAIRWSAAQAPRRTPSGDWSVTPEAPPRDPTEAQQE